jgi:hypothetical protein
VSQRIYTGAATVIAVAATLALAGCGNSGPAPQDMPGYGSAVVPCAQIRSQVAEILPYYQYPGPDHINENQVYSLEKALATRFGNVSNLDEPLALSKAEVDFDVAVTSVQRLSSGIPFIYAQDLDTAVHELAAACRITG